jgi:hypothetical protein
MRYAVGIRRPTEATNALNVLIRLLDQALNGSMISGSLNEIVSGTSQTASLHC